MHFKKGQAMKKRETETTEVTEETTGAGVIAQIVATAAAARSGGWESTARFVNAISLELPLPYGVRY